MRYTYSDQDDALYVELSKRGVVRTETVSEACLVDLDEHGVAVGIEVIGLRHGFPLESLATKYHLDAEARTALEGIVSALLAKNLSYA